MSQANIQSTERQFRTLRHVPDNMSAYQVHANRQGNFNPDTDEATIEAEVEKVLVGARYALQVATGGHRPTVYCPSQAVLERVKQRLSADEQNRMILGVSV